MAREQALIFLSFNPIIRDGQGFKKVKSLNFTYKFKQQNEIVNRNLATSSIQNSVLSSGNWFRFYVEKSGVYLITKSFLSELGVDVNADPRTIKIYGNGGRMLPLRNDVFYPNDLEENAIQFIGEQDGVFNDSDYILFYAEGVDNWNEESLTHVNLFSDRSYYYVTYGGGNGKRMLDYQEPTSASVLNLNTYDGYQFHEVDLYNPGKIGRRWFGEAFDVDSDQTFNFSLSNYIVGSNVTLSSNFSSVSFGNTSFKIKVNGSDLVTLPMGSLSAGAIDVLGYENVSEKTFTSSTSNIAIDILFNNGGVPSSKGYLDYLILKCQADLKGYGKQFRFSNALVENNAGVGQFTMSNASSIKMVRDITDIYNVKKIDNTQSTLTFKLNLGTRRKFVAIDFSTLAAVALPPNFVCTLDLSCCVSSMFILPNIDNAVDIK